MKGRERKKSPFMNDLVAGEIFHKSGDLGAAPFIPSAKKMNAKKKMVDILVIGFSIIETIANIPSLPKKKGQVLAKNWNTSIGGCAASVSVFASALGLRSSIVTRIGNDEDGEKIKKRFKGLDVDIKFIGEDAKLKTGRAFLVISPDGDWTSFSHLGAGMNLKNELENLDQITIKNAKVVYVDSYALLSESNRRAIRKVIGYCRALGTRVAVDTCLLTAVEFPHELRDVLSQADIIFANEREIKTLFKVRSTEEAVEKLEENNPNMLYCVVKLGRRGSKIFFKNGVLKIPAIPVKAVTDTLGCGDAYNTGFLLGVLKGLGPKDAGLLGAGVASKVIQWPGSQSIIPSRKEVLKNLARHGYKITIPT